jgi:pimeloyl-ACP methyl ester carboxylesterase
MESIVPQSPTLKYIRTPVLEIAYEESGPASGAPVLLMHGFPYDPRTYDDVVPARPGSCRRIRRARGSRRRSARICWTSWMR